MGESMRIVDLMLEKYAPRPLKDKGSLVIRWPAGGMDVYRLCGICDTLEAIVRRLQDSLPYYEQNAIEAELEKLDL